MGSALLNSRTSGKILLLSLVISSLITGVFLRFIPDGTSESLKNVRKKIPLSSAIVSSVSSASSSMLVCCGFVCFFSGLIAVIGEAVNSQTAKTIVSCLLEVTNGCAVAAGNISLPAMAAACAFGGLCVHLQIFSLSKDFGMNIPLFYLFRVIHSTLAYAACRIILYFYPVEVSASVSLGTNVEMWSFSAPAAMSLLFMCSLLILDLDNSKNLC